MLQRSVVALVAVLVLLGLLVGGAEWLVRGQVEAVVSDLVEDRLAQESDGDGFASVDSSLQGLALLGLARGRFDRVRVDAVDGTVGGVPVGAVQVVADGVSTDGREVAGLSATVSADAGALVASRLDPAAAEAVAASAAALPPDRVRIGAPYDVPGLGAVPLEVELLVRVADGGVVVEPAAARAAGQDLDLTQVPGLPTFGVAADQLPAGLRADAVEVVERDGRPVLELDLSCVSGCSLR